MIKGPSFKIWFYPKILVPDSLDGSYLIKNNQLFIGDDFSAQTLVEQRIRS